MKERTHRATPTPFALRSDVVLGMRSIVGRTLLAAAVAAAGALAAGLLAEPTLAPTDAEFPAVR